MSSQTKCNARCGFSIIEIVIVLGLLSFFFVVANFTYQAITSRNNFATVVSSTVSALRSAQARSAQGQGGGRWGVKVSEANVTIFKGDTYAAREALHDQELSFPVIITTSGTTEVVFERISGYAVQAAQLNLAFGEANQNILIGEYGTITY